MFQGQGMYIVYRRESENTGRDLVEEKKSVKEGVILVALM